MSAADDSTPDPRMRAAIDVGTNTILLVVARERADGSLDVVEDACVTARLGEGVARTGELQPQAIERALGALRGFRERLDHHRVAAERVRAVGTAVFRRAHDSARFLSLAREETCIAIEVLSEDEEARIAHAAVVRGGDPRARVIDVGGGSTEVIANGGRSRVSLPIGALMLTELYLEGGVATRRSWELLLQAIDAAVGSLPPDPEASSPDPSEVVVVGGTALNLGSLALGLPRFDHTRTEGARVEAAESRRWAEVLAFESLESRSRHPIEASRAAILPAGLACLAAAAARAGAKNFRVSGRGLRFGVLYEMTARGGERGPRGPFVGID